ncbi:MAG TPA: dihydroorotase [Armatimonadetes bacterium]|nr:dihydroorotase [Armatimonadota bacterium]
MKFSSTVLLKGGRVLDPSQRLDRVCDILIIDGRVAEVAEGIEPPSGARVLDCQGLVVSPGFVDLHVHLRLPGDGKSETMATGTRAAAKGGFTTILAMPNTQPPIDSASLVSFVKAVADREAVVRVEVAASPTKGMEGEELCDIVSLKRAGALALSDDGAPIQDSAVLRRVMEYAGSLGLPLLLHPEDKSLTLGGCAHEGEVSLSLGLRGMPEEAEEIGIAKILILNRKIGAKVHIQHVSTSFGVDILRAARRAGISFTCEVTPHHLTLTDELLRSFDPDAKVNPPLRGKEHVTALREALAEGLFSAIATDHAPHALELKEVEFEEAPFGMVGLETALGLLLTKVVGEGALDLQGLVRLLTEGPAKVLGLSDRGTLRPGAMGDAVAFDPEEEWTVKPEEFESLSRNTPLKGWRLKGKVIHTVVGGEVVVEGGEVVA